MTPRPGPWRCEGGGAVARGMMTDVAPCWRSHRSQIREVLGERKRCLIHGRLGGGMPAAGYGARGVGDWLVWLRYGEARGPWWQFV